MTYIYQVPCEVYNQFVKYLEAFKIGFKVLRDNIAPHTYGLIQVTESLDIIDDVSITLNKLIDYINKKG